MAGNIVELTSDNFDNEVTNSKIPVLVDFWATWCGPCKALAPVLDEIANEISGKARIAKVNIEDAPELANQAGILNIPTLVLYKDGEAVERIVGINPKQKILEVINSAL